MLDICKYYADCNREINKHILEIIEKQPFDVFNHRVEGFYKSIAEILTHLYVGDISWLNSFRTVKAYSIFKDPLFDKLPQYGVKLFDTVAQFKGQRSRLDGIIDDLVKEIETTDLYKMNSRINRAGIKQEKIFWKCLVHMFNHQTHHRGQVSQVLDQLNIQNDFSNMIFY